MINHFSIKVKNKITRILCNCALLFLKFIKLLRLYQEYHLDKVFRAFNITFIREKEAVTPALKPTISAQCNLCLSPLRP